MGWRPVDDAVYCSKQNGPRLIVETHHHTRVWQLVLVLQVFASTMIHKKVIKSYVSSYISTMIQIKKNHQSLHHILCIISYTSTMIHKKKIIESYVLIIIHINNDYWKKKSLNNMYHHTYLQQFVIKKSLNYMYHHTYLQWFIKKSILKSWYVSSYIYKKSINYKQNNTSPPFISTCKMTSVYRNYLVFYNYQKKSSRLKTTNVSNKKLRHILENSFKDAE